MKFACLVMSGMFQDEIFNLKSQLNRDNGFYSWSLLKSAFLKKDIEIHTSDMCFDKHVEFEVHTDVWVPISRRVKGYLLLLETTQVRPENSIQSRLDCYRKIFTWNDELVDNVRFFKINFPNPINIHFADGYAKRDRFCCLIAGNKTLGTKDDRNLYPERVKAIRWFEQHALQDFDLYGVDWNLPVPHYGVLGKIERCLFRFITIFFRLQSFPSYRGKIARKHDVLTRTRFSICYENVRDLPGYITEKIFDCFFAGCVPVYWGASNITSHIPEDCFIDRRNFKDTGEVYAFLKAMTEQDFYGYQQRIVAFLQSEAAYPFSSEFFAETIVKTIAQDLGV